MTVAAVNRRLDALARTTLVIGGRRCNAFRVCGTVGYVLGVADGAALAAVHGRSPWLVVALGAVAAVTFTVLSAYSRAPDGGERLVYYHHQLAVLATTTATLLVAGAPILGYLDSVVVGLGTFLVFGRVGCLMVGCCHGRPAPIGLRYGAEHVRAGFPPHRAGVRLLPVQALESGWTLACVGLAIRASWRGPGAGAAAYVLAYAAGRYVLEYARGDGARPYLLAVSEAQWSSVALAGVVVAAEASGVVPAVAAHVVVAALLAAGALATLAVGVLRRGSERLLLTPRHLDEVASTVAHLAGQASIAGRRAVTRSPVPSEVHISETSQGLAISASTIVRPDAAVHHFGLSRAGGLGADTAGAIGSVLCILTDEEPRPALPSRGGDVFHLTVVHRVGRR
jgi:Prolipoprotein diacylglyceryl transferase